MRPAATSTCDGAEASPNNSPGSGGPRHIYDDANVMLDQSFPAGSVIKLHGSSGKDSRGFFGWAVGKTLVVDGNMAAHYDETRDPKTEAFKIHLVE